MFSHKLDFYNEKPCKWMEFYLNFVWPIMILFSLSMLISAAVNWTNNSTAIIVSSLYTIVGLLLSDLFVRFLDTVGFVFWFIGNLTPIITNVALVVMMSAGVANDIMTARPTVRDAVSLIGNTAFSMLYSVVAVGLIIDGIVLLVINTVYIIRRKKLFLRTEYELERELREYEESL